MCSLEGVYVERDANILFAFFFIHFRHFPIKFLILQSTEFSSLKAGKKLEVREKNSLINMLVKYPYTIKCWNESDAKWRSS